MFGKVLVANRGEIAVRVQHGLQAMGVRTVAVYSDPDQAAPHVAMADEALPLHGSTPAESYLDVGKIVDAALRSGAEAVHPGYGFLAESADLARGCEDAGLVFIGPTADVIDLMGDKVRAKEAAVSAGVPIVPSVMIENGDRAAAMKAAKRLGYPVLAKAVAGGGGRGLRLVRRPQDLPEEMEAAAREALAAFGDGRILLEEWLPSARHIEVQVLGDHHGRVVHLFERECSIQRRHQKLIEETPSPAIDAAQRQRITGSAVALATAVGYRNAGTVEFLLTPDGRHLFLEMNTRLQVEHPITEAVTGLDLVREQVRIAAGGTLGDGIGRVESRGHAIECRVYAENPYSEFSPSVGRLLRWAPPSGPGIRIDSGVAQGQQIDTHYDSLLAKVTVWGQDRPAALARMEQALRRFVILGVTTTAPFLASVLRHHVFASGDYNTRSLEEHPELFQSSETENLGDLAAALSAWAGPGRGTTRETVREADAVREQGPWAQGGGWRLG